MVIVHLEILVIFIEYLLVVFGCFCPFTPCFGSRFHFIVFMMITGVIVFEFGHMLLVLACHLFSFIQMLLGNPCLLAGDTALCMHAH